MATEVDLATEIEELLSQIERAESRMKELFNHAQTLNAKALSLVERSRAVVSNGPESPGIAQAAPVSRLGTSRGYH